MTDPNDLTTIAPEFNDPPALAFFDLVASASTTHKSRYALRVAGLDAEGVMRCLVLTWDGEWMQVHPVTGFRLKLAMEFKDGEVGRSKSGQVLTCAWRGGWDGADIIRVWFMDDMGTKHAVPVLDGELLEVLP